MRTSIVSGPDNLVPLNLEGRKILFKVEANLWSDISRVALRNCRANRVALWFLIGSRGMLTAIPSLLPMTLMIVDSAWVQ